MNSSLGSLEERAGYRIEEYAERVVGNIERFVEILRDIPEFSSKETTDVACVKLYSLVKQQGMCTALRVSVQLVATDLGRRKPFAFEERSDVKDERIMVIKEILIPLFGALTQCYMYLDELPQPAPPSNGTNGSSNGKQQKPAPPHGMLSLKDYTNIAVLLEFFVCTSILPNLDNNVLTSVPSRVKHLLPKSMAGRIPRKSLLWGHRVYKRKSAELAVEELECAVATIGELVLLDRFRPMLMPRHLTDLYAAIFQESHMRIAETPGSTQYSEVGEMLFPGPHSVVDTVAQAKTCQTLLLKGTRGPRWLREVVSDLLTDLTCRDLRAIVHVFVRQASSSQTDMTSASLRLAGPLTSVQDDKQYYTRLCAQLVSLLDAEGPLEEALGDADIAAGALTVVSVLDVMSLENIHVYFLPILTNLLLEPIYSTFEIHRFVRRLGLLLGVIPETHNSFKIGLLCKTPFEHSDQPGSRVSILGQLIRIGAIQSTVKAQIKEDALMALRLMFRAMAQARYPNSGGVYDIYSDGTDVTSLALLHTLQDSWWDKNGYKYKVSIPEGKNGMTGIAVEQEDSDPSDIAAILDTLETRVSFVIERLIVPLASSIQLHEAIMGTDTDDKAISAEGTEQGDIVSHDGNRLVSSFFHLLLICYFNVMSKGSGDSKPQGGDKQVQSVNDLEGQFAIMVALPMLCEMCPPDALILGGRKGGGKSILKMMKVILSSATSGIECPAESEPESDESALETKEELKRQVTMGRMLTRSLSNQSLEIVETDLVEQDPKEEGLLSTASVVLSLLIAMLELGIKRRNAEEELILEAMLPTLRRLTFAGRSTKAKADDDISQIRSEMAEMATHAIALIISRGAEELDMKQEDDTSAPRSFEEILEEAERDLKSDQPPIRARGLVTLRHVARGWLEAMDDSSSTSGRPLIEEIDASLSRLEPAIDINPVREIFRVALVAIEDKESYVYLAGIQTLVAAADARPVESLPLLTRALCAGTVQLRGKDVLLSQEQRIKLAEALSFILRRRGDAINDFIPKLMQLLIYGKGMDSMRSKKFLDKPDLDSIRKETHEYFNGSSISNFSSDDDAELKALRVSTGGPLFEAEESHVLRSACINMVSELLSIAAPNVMASYCFNLVQLAKSALVLDVSRPVRRSAALLSRELYAAVLRELDFVLERHEHGASIIPEQSFLLTLSECGEEALQVTLEQCVSSAGDNYDPATTARCEEALKVRQEISALGLFAAAEIYIMTAEREKEDMKAQLVRKRLGEGSKNGGRGIRKLFGRGRGKRPKNEGSDR